MMGINHIIPQSFRTQNQLNLREIPAEPNSWKVAPAKLANYVILPIV